MDLNLEYTPTGSKQGNADGISRLPLPTTFMEVPQPAETILLMERLNVSLVNTVPICSWINRDPTLANIRKSVLEGWPDISEDKEMDLYFQRRKQLSIEDGCILWGVRVVVPSQLN